MIECLGQQAAVDGYSLGTKFSLYIDLSAEVAKYLKLPEGVTLSLADMCTRAFRDDRNTSARTCPCADALARSPPSHLPALT